MSAEILVKVGGSLFDLANLGANLRAWLATLRTPNVLIAPGGAAAANLVRQADELDQLGEEESHWLALRGLAFTARLLAARLGAAEVISDPADRYTSWAARRIPVLDLYAFARADEAQLDHLPHDWSVTSDSLAARVAILASIPKLYLLKSCEVPEDWAAAASQGVVDAAFPGTLALGRLHAVGVNFRQWAAGRASVIVLPGPEPSKD